MTVTRLVTRRVEKPWGRTKLWRGFADPVAGASPVGEIWFEAPGESPQLLVKYLFTSERLSVQVHPNDETARASGFPRGKDEAWIILDAEPGATIALGPKQPMSKDELRTAALDGSIVDLLDWRPVARDDVIYSPAGTVHAIGAGITLVEVQQNVDCTYRLYDYDRPRELHLDSAVASASPTPFGGAQAPLEIEPGRNLIADGAKFSIERWSGPCDRRLLIDERSAWLVPLSGTGSVDGHEWCAGECWLIEDDSRIVASAGADLLVATAAPDGGST